MYTGRTRCGTAQAVWPVENEMEEENLDNNEPMKVFVLVASNGLRLRRSTSASCASARVVLRFCCLTDSLSEGINALPSVASEKFAEAAPSENSSPAGIPV